MKQEKDDNRSLREAILGIVSGFQGTETKISMGSFLKTVDLGAAKDILTAMGNIAGKGKDEIVQILAREFGFALAAMLREPLTQALKEKKLQITIELVPDQTKKTRSKR